MLKDALRIVVERDTLATAVLMGYVTESNAKHDLIRLNNELRIALPTAFK